MKVKKAYTLLEMFLVVVIVSSLVILLTPKTEHLESAVSDFSEGKNQAVLTTEADIAIDKLQDGTRLYTALELSKLVYDDIKTIDGIKSMVNPDNIESRGLSYVNSSNPYQDGYAAYILESESLKSNLPKGTVYYVVSDLKDISEGIVGTLPPPVVPQTPPAPVVPPASTTPEFNGMYYEIWYIDQLAYIGTDTTTKTYNYKLMRDLDFTDINHYVNTAKKTTYTTGAGWVPITGFKGRLHGQEHTISNLYIYSTNGDNIGLFADMNAIITDLSLDNVNITGRDYVGSIVGTSVGSYVDNCTVTGKITGRNRIGGIVGNYAGVNSKFSYNSASVVMNGASYVGGMVGYLTESSFTSNTVSKVTVTGTSEYIGGLIGMAADPNFLRIEVQNSGSDADVTGPSKIGGLIGYSSYIVKNSYATGNVTESYTSNSAILKGYVGGLIGEITGEVRGCYATGNVTALNSYVGGLVGQAGNAVEGSYATGNVTSTGNCVGGLIGISICLKSNMVVFTSILNCAYTGTIKGNEYVGGLAGITYHNTTSSFVKANITGTKRVGGLAGSINSRSDVTGSTNRVIYCYVLESTITDTGGTEVGGIASSANTEMYAEQVYIIATFTNPSTYKRVTVPYHYSEDISVYHSTNIVDSSLPVTTLEDLKKKETFKGFYFGSTWAIDPAINSGYPYLINNPLKIQ